jgi:uncharacterized protein YbbK (DUF523 family)
VIKVLVSSCLLGEPVRYHGGAATLESGVLDRWRAEGRVVAACPEVAGGLSVPRAPAEITGGDGDSVLAGRAFVGDRSGADVTAAFLDGARRTLDLARAAGVGLAVLKDGSPSCGTTYVYDGTFRGQRSAGRGLTAALLAQNGIPVFSERQLAEAAAYVESLETPGA